MSETMQTQDEAQTEDNIDVPMFVAEHCGFEPGNVPSMVEFDVTNDTDTNQLHRLMDRFGWRVMDTDFLNGVIYFVPKE